LGRIISPWAGTLLSRPEYSGPGRHKAQLGRHMAPPRLGRRPSRLGRHILIRLGRIFSPRLGRPASPRLGRSSTPRLGLLASSPSYSWPRYRAAPRLRSRLGCASAGPLHLLRADIPVASGHHLQAAIGPAGILSSSALTSGPGWHSCQQARTPPGRHPSGRNFHGPTST
jgi:hypothetical protein